MEDQIGRPLPAHGHANPALVTDGIRNVIVPFFGSLVNLKKVIALCARIGHGYYHFGIVCGTLERHQYIALQFIEASMDARFKKTNPFQRGLMCRVLLLL